MTIIKKIISLLTFITALISCSETFDHPVLNKRPVMNYSLTADTLIFIHADQPDTIAVGPEKEFEVNSDVIYRLDITSEVPLTAFNVRSTSLNRSPINGVIHTEPEGAVDENGNFTMPMTQVKIYYKYHIATEDAPGEPIVLTFTTLNERNAEVVRMHTFQPLRAGSTNGTRLLLLGNIVMTHETFLDRPLNNLGASSRMNGGLLNIDDNITYTYTGDVTDISKIDIIGLVDYTANKMFFVSANYSGLKSGVRKPIFSFLYNPVGSGKTIYGIKFKKMLAYNKEKFQQTTHNELFDADFKQPPAAVIMDPIAVGDIIGFLRYDGSRGLIYIESFSRDITRISIKYEERKK